MELLEKLLGTNIWLTIITFIFLLSAFKIFLDWILDLVKAFKINKALREYEKAREDITARFAERLRGDTKDN